MLMAKLSSEDLDKIYPKPKTYDQIEQDNLERQKLFESRRPERPAEKIALFTSGILLFTLIFLENFQAILFSTIVGISLILSIVLISCFAIYTCAKFIDRTFYSYGKSKTMFLTICIVSAVILIYAPHFSIFDGINKIILCLTFTVFYFIINYSVLRRIFDTKS